jgi:hypothetical protein
MAAQTTEAPIVEHVNGDAQATEITPENKALAEEAKEQANVAFKGQFF